MIGNGHAAHSPQKRPCFASLPSLRSSLQAGTRSRGRDDGNTDRLFRGNHICGRWHACRSGMCPSPPSVCLRASVRTTCLSPTGDATTGSTCSAGCLSSRTCRRANATATRSSCGTDDARCSSDISNWCRTNVSVDAVSAHVRSMCSGRRCHACEL